MGDVVLIDKIRAEREQELREQREVLAQALELMAARARDGEVIGVCIAAVPTDRQSITVAAYKTEICGSHELVGASTILANYIVDAASRG